MDAKQLQQSMMGAKELREREYIHPMAYKMIPEVWKRLGEEDGGDNLQKAKKEDTAKNHVGEAKQVRSNQTMVQHFNAMLHNPLTAYDKD